MDKRYKIADGNMPLFKKLFDLKARIRYSRKIDGEGELLPWIAWLITPLLMLDLTLFGGTIEVVYPVKNDES